MTLQEFEEALLLQGADLARWPEDLRERADRLLAADPAAEALRREIAELDADLGAAMAVEVNAAAVAARTQAAVRNRIERQGLLAMLPIGRILGFGSLAGIGGAAAALASPAAFNSGLLLAIALGGTTP